MSAYLTPEREATIRCVRDDGLRADVDIDDALDDLLTEVNRLRAALKDAADQVAERDDEIGKLAARPSHAEVLRQEADEIVAYCPVHSPWDEAWMDCHCDVADEMRRRANKAAPGVTA